MRHVIVFCYIFTILIGVSALTVQWLSERSDKSKQQQRGSFSVMRPFIALLLFMNVYDFLIYYGENIINQPRGNLLLSIGDALIAILVFLWFRVSESIGSKKWPVAKIAERYVIFYMIIWIIAVIFFRHLYWIRLIIDVPLILLLLMGGIVGIVNDLKNDVPRMLVVYKGVITFFMTTNYASYFISETGLIRQFNDNIMAVTIFYWLVINVANIMLLYKRDFHDSYLTEPKPVGIDLDEALETVRSKYELTNREIEILEEVYDGKTNTQIAEALFISESTVKAHIYNLFRKLGVKSRVEAVCIVREVKEGKA